MFLRAAAAGLVLAFTSCAPGSARLALDTTLTSSSLVRAAVAGRTAGLRTLAGRGSIAFATPEMSGTAAFTSALRRPDSLLVLLEGPLGIDVGSLFISRERYVVVNTMENRVFTGDPRAATLRSLLPVDLPAGQILDAFAGIFMLPEGEPDSFSIEEGMFRLSYRCEPHRCEFWVDPDEQFVRRYRRTGADGRTILEASCAAITRDGDATVARRVTVRFPAEDRQISIAYSDVALNTDDLSFAFTIPPGARTTVR
jgi:catechol 2,3-dioxygenase-like lactoylglutathione lyase family enzyme